jgi:uroporphyrin-III C-methyltransferase/precorrin-2 dehydrogenase/sirohydrochlorin ferrochelatase
MDYFPIFVAVKTRQVVLLGAGEECVHKARLVMKSSAAIHVFHDDPNADIDPQFLIWQEQGHVTLHHRMVEGTDCQNAAFAFIGTEHDANRLKAREIFDGVGLLYAVIDNKAQSRFITPALVDRDPVVVAIGTEGTGPIIARDIKSKIESLLHPATGAVAKVAGLFRPQAKVLPKGALRRRFWSQYLEQVVPGILTSADTTKATSPKDRAMLEARLTQGLQFLLTQVQRQQDGAMLAVAKPSVKAIEVYTDDPDLLTRKAMSVLHDADVVVHDGSIPSTILELTRRESKRLSIAEMPRHRVTQQIIADHQQGQKVFYLYAYGQSPVIDLSVFSETGITVDTLLAFPKIEPKGAVYGKGYRQGLIALKEVS